MQAIFKIYCHEYTFDFLELQKKRPSLTLRRIASLAFTRALLVEKKFLSPEHAKTVGIHRKKSGEPFLQSSENINHLLPSISVSHSGVWIACLLSDKKAPACVDIEDMTFARPYKKLAAYAFSKEENQFVLQTGELGFYKLWTAKEAIAKCNGKGLNYALKIDLGAQLANPVNTKRKIVNVGDTNYQIFQELKKKGVFVTIVKK